MRTILLPCAALFLLSSAAQAQDSASAPPVVEPSPADSAGGTEAEEPRRKKRFQLGLDVGAFFPTSRKTRDRFGGTWYSIGPGFSAVRRAGEKGRIGLDIDLMSQSKNGNRALLIPAGVSFTRALGKVDEEKSSHPFVGASLLAIPARIRSAPDGVDDNFKLGAGAAAFVGTTFGERAFVEARYMVTTRISGFSFSGASVRVGYRF
jgi:hypothetical protein